MIAIAVEDSTHAVCLSLSELVTIFLRPYLRPPAFMMARRASWAVRHTLVTSVAGVTLPSSTPMVWWHVYVYDWTKECAAYSRESNR
jgi:hypothetical protein